MIYKQVENATQLKDYFVHYNRDKYTEEEYQAIFDYYDSLEEDVAIDPVAISCSLVNCSWADIDLSMTSQVSSSAELLEYLKKYTTVLYFDDSDVLFFNY